MEWERKILHVVTGCLIAFIYLWLQISRMQILVILGGIAVAYSAMDMVRLRIFWLNEKLKRRLRRLSKRSEERDRITTGTFFLFGAWLTILFFPKVIAVSVILFATLGDVMASIVGRYGEAKILFRKTLEGSLACFFTCLFVGFWLFRDFNYFLPISLIGALSASLTELSSSRRWDNFTVPLITGFILWLLL